MLRTPAPPLPLPVTVTNAVSWTRKENCTVKFLQLLARCFHFSSFFCCHGNQMQQAKLAQDCQAGETRCWFYQPHHPGCADEQQDRLLRAQSCSEPHPLLCYSSLTANFYQLVTAGGAGVSLSSPSSRRQPTPRPIIGICLGESCPAST